MGGWGKKGSKNCHEIFVINIGVNSQICQMSEILQIFYGFPKKVEEQKNKVIIGIVSHREDLCVKEVSNALYHQGDHSVT